MSNKTIDISVIIPTMNRSDDLKRTIKSLINGSKLPDEIIIIDQSSDSKTFNLIEMFQNEDHLTKFIYYQMSGEPSLTRARNKGLKLVNSNTILFSDDDVDYEFNSLDNLHNYINKSDIAMVGARDLNAQKTFNVFGVLFFRKNLFKKNKGHVTRAIFGRYPSGTIRDTVETEWCMGYCFAIKRNLLDRMKLKFDEKLLSYGYAEDLLFSAIYARKAKKMNFKSVLAADVSVRHNVSPSSRLTPFKATLQYIHHRYYINNILFSKWNVAFLIWSDFGELLRRVIKKNKPFDLIKSYYLLTRHYHNIAKGDFSYVKTK